MFEAEYKFGYRNDGMRIVELNRTQLSEILEIVAVLFLVALYYILYGRTYKEVLLAQTQSLTFDALVVGIENVRNDLRRVLLRKSVRIVHIVEFDIIEFVYRLALPQTQGVYGLSAVSYYREVVRHRLDLHVSEGYYLRFVLAAY